MKTDIHPAYFPAATVTCACGNTFTVGSTREKIHVEICSACHPFYTGNEKVLDAAGRVEKFKARASKAEAAFAKASANKSAAAKAMADTSASVKERAQKRVATTSKLKKNS